MHSYVVQPTHIFWVLKWWAKIKKKTTELNEHFKVKEENS